MGSSTANGGVNRRQFLASASATALLASVPASVRGARTNVTLLPVDKAWLYRRGPLTAETARTVKDGWQTVDLPHCTNAYDACDPDRPYFQGQSWYKVQAHAANPYSRGRTLLRFRGAGQTTSVWAGQTLLGTHVGGYDEFVFDVTDVGGMLDLLVYCDNTPDEDRSPSNLSDFCVYGGLYRHVDLIYLPALAFEEAVLQPEINVSGPATLRISARLHGQMPSPSNASCKLRIEITDPSGASVATRTMQRDAWTDLQELASIEIPQPMRWSPAQPHLYRCRLTLQHGADTSVHEERFGLRHVAFPEHDVFYLNGEKLFLRGTQRHQDHAAVAAGQSDESVRQEMQMIRAMGANFIRLGHYQQDRLVLDLCDELGLLVWEEVPWCRAGVGSETWKNNTRAQMRRMIEQHRNHPSIVFWGLGNEDDWPDEHPSVNKPEIRTFMTELREMAHEMDPSRLTSYRRCDFASDIPDVYSPSIWAGWYNGVYSEYANSLKTSMPKVKRFLHIEWGADSHAGRHSEDPYATLTHVTTDTGTEERSGDYLRSGGSVRVSRDGDWSETYACDLFDWYLKTQEALPKLAGSAQWVFKDFASPLRADSPVPRVNQKGLVGRDLTPKECYAVFQSYWSAEPMIHIYGRTWPRRWGHEGQKRTVKVYSNCSEVELFLNGTSLGARKRDSQNFPAANLRWDVVFRPGDNTLKAVSRGAVKSVEDTLQLIYQTDAWAKPAALRLKRVGEENGVTKCVAEIVDANGVLCLDARNQVRFHVESGLNMLDNLGTVGGSRVVETANGVASISVKRVAAGTLSVSAAGLTGAAVQF